MPSHRARNARRPVVVLTSVTVCLALAGAGIAASGDATVGRQPDGAVVLPDGQRIMPAGEQLRLPGRVTGVAVRPDGRTAVVHTASGSPGLYAIDLDHDRVLQAFAGGTEGDFAGVAYSPDGTRVWSSGASGPVAITEVRSDGTLSTSRSVTTPTVTNPPTACCNAYPGGLATSSDGKTGYVALSRANSLGVIDMTSGAVTAQVPVGNAPHDVVVSGGKAYVTNEGGRPAQPGDYTNRSAGTPIVADSFTGAATTGTVSVVDLATRAEVAEIPVGLHPTAMQLDGRWLFVANTDSDTVSVIDTTTDKTVSTIAIRPFEGAPYGSMPTGITVADGRLVVSLGGNNALAVLDWATPSEPASLDGLIPTGWYPADVAYDALHHRLLVANEKGDGSVGDADAGKTRRSVGAEVASVQLVPLPSGGRLRQLTKDVFAANGWGHTESSPARPGVAPVAVPARIGEPSLIKHVIYVIKENRTYDQILGDIGRGNSDPSLTMFGKTVTPNHHALATQFPLLDNFYDSGRRSNDGHNWATQASAPDYLEKGVSTQRTDWASGGTPPSSGFDALLYLPSGFLWENALRHGKTFDDFGEYTAEDQPPPARSDKPSLDAHVVREFQGFNLQTPDIDRARIFQAHLATYEAAGRMPDLITLTLSNDHTGGSNPLYLTPESQVADNDNGLGTIVDAVSHSSFWKNTAIFVVEDDSQGGVDHVDGHRSLCLVASAYSKHNGYIDSTFYTQVSVVRTIEQILGLPPMNQMDLAAEPMRDVFADTPDLTPFDLAPSSVTAQMNPPLSALRGLQREWAQAVPTDELRHLDDADPNVLNHDIWYAVKGYDTPYPGEARVLHPWEVRRTPSSDTTDGR